MTPLNTKNICLDLLTRVAIHLPAQTRDNTKLSTILTIALIAAGVVKRNRISCDGRDTRSKDDEWESVNNLKQSRDLTEEFENTQGPR